MVMLGAVLVYLILNGRGRESPQLSPPIEVVKSSKPTRTRVFAPQDLKLVESKLELVRSNGTANARHHVVIRNEGLVTYRNTLLKFSYFGPGERSLGTKTGQITDPILSGQTLSAEVVVEEIAAATVKSSLRIVYSEIEPPVDSRAPSTK